MVKCAQVGLAGAFFLASYWSAGLGHFFRHPTLASHWLKDLQAVHQQQRENTNGAPPTLREALAASQKKLLSWVNYTPLVVSDG